MKKLFLTCSAVAVLLIACDKEDSDNMELNSTDQAFITQVAFRNSAEISAGQLAATKGTDAAVRAYGQLMVTEHGQAQTELKTLGTSVGLNVLDSVDALHQSIMQHLDTLTGYSFDTAYINNQVNVHESTLNIFQNEISTGGHQEVKAYASKYLPAIQMHYNKADSLQNEL